LYSKPERERGETPLPSKGREERGERRANTIVNFVEETDKRGGTKEHLLQEKYL
jgi:hypothetical protein